MMTNEGTNGSVKNHDDGNEKNHDGGDAENQHGEKILIGVLASHDGFEQHNSLHKLFEHVEKHGYGKDDNGNLIKDKYHFLITGGTYERLLYGDDFEVLGKNGKKIIKKLKGFKIKKNQNGKETWFEKNTTKLPSANEGGVIILSYLITQRQCCIVWPFFSHESQHWQRLENLAFMRLCDKCHVKRLLNERSVRTWLGYEAGEYDSNLKLRVNPTQISFPHFKVSDYKNFEKRNGQQYNLKELIDSINKINPSSSTILFPQDIEILSKELKNFQKSQDDPVKLPLDFNPLPASEISSDNKVLNYFRELFYAGDNKVMKFEDMTIALIAHNEMKPRMIDFAVDYETELKKFKKILATGTTGREVAAATSKELDNKLFRCHSGPEGGDIEIATAILYGLCDVVIFFIDPLQAHPHIEDIRVVLQACMMNENVIIITNEMHSREFMARVVRNHKEINL